jgi:hypothetical protein
MINEITKKFILYEFGFSGFMLSELVFLTFESLIFWGSDIFNFIFYFYFYNQFKLNEWMLFLYYSSNSYNNKIIDIVD